MRRFLLASSLLVLAMPAYAAGNGGAKVYTGPVTGTYIGKGAPAPIPITGTVTITVDRRAKTVTEAFAPLPGVNQSLVPVTIVQPIGKKFSGSAPFPVLSYDIGTDTGVITRNKITGTLTETFGMGGYISGAFTYTATPQK